MSKITEALRTHGIFNPHALLKEARSQGLHDVYIEYSPAERGRGHRAARWQVIRPGYKTDPDGHWMDHGHMTFSVWRGAEKAEKKKDAILWASKRYNIPVEDWVVCPGFPGVLVPSEVATFAKLLAKNPKVT